MMTLTTVAVGTLIGTAIGTAIYLAVERVWHFLTHDLGGDGL